MYDKKMCILILNVFIYDSTVFHVVIVLLFCDQIMLSLLQEHIDQPSSSYSNS